MHDEELCYKVRDGNEQENEQFANAQMQWIGAVTMDGEYITEGHGTSRKKGQAADAEALIRSGSLPDFAEFK